MNRLVHDLARLIEGHEVERQRRQHDRADNHLIALRMRPDISEEALFHQINDAIFLSLNGSLFPIWGIAIV
jgi:hypothetical protein